MCINRSLPTIFVQH